MATWGGLDGGESITATWGGLDGGESITAAWGGLDGGESITAAWGGLDGGESMTANAEPAIAQPATKATRLTFIMIPPNELLIDATLRRSEMGLPVQVTATRGVQSPHAVVNGWLVES